MRRLYDVVIVDAPPLLPVTDAALLTAHSDGALVVVRHGKTSKEQLRHSKDRLDAVGGRAIGVVLNMVPTGGDGYGTGTSRRGYGKAPEPVFEHQQSAQPVPAAHGRRLSFFLVRSENPLPGAPLDPTSTSTDDERATRPLPWCTH